MEASAGLALRPLLEDQDHAQHMTSYLAPYPPEFP